MGLICKVTDKDIGQVAIEMENPEVRLGARGIVVREDGKIAIFNKSNKNEYKLPGGGLEGQEKPEEAFKRGVLEETGCEVEIVKYLGTTEEYKTLNNFKQVSYIFIGKVTKDTQKLNVTKKEAEEGARLLWKTPKEALKLITNCFDNLVDSKYETVYSTKFIVLRDRKILETYIAKETIDNIRNYIIDVLPQIMDDKIFKIKSREELGQYYFDKILKEVMGSDKELVERIIYNIYPSIEKQGLDCYEILLRGCYLYYMPKEKMKFVKEQIRIVFRKDYKKLKNTYNKKLKELEQEISEIDNKIEENKQKAKIAYKKIEEDLGIYLKEEQEYLARRKILETQKMEIEFLYQDVEEKVKAYFKEEGIPERKGTDLIKSRKEIRLLLKREALRLAKEKDEELGRINPFRYYEIIINRAIEIIKDPEVLNYISITYVPLVKAQKEAYYAYARNIPKEMTDKIPEADEIKTIRQNNENDYAQLLEKIINQYNVIKEMEEILSKEEIYNIRKITLLELMEQYKKKAYHGFVAGIPSQIEGMFYDWLREITRYQNFEELNTFYDKFLKEKIQLIMKSERGVETPIMVYYYTFFNDLRRNRTAHGKMEYTLIGSDVKTVADELLLDLYTLLWLSTGFCKNESRKMKELMDGINNEEEIEEKRKLLQLDLLGSRTFLGYPHIYKIAPMQFVYWLINPYYYEIYKSWGYETQVNNVRKLFFEKEIWEDFLKQIKDSLSWKWNAANISREFINVVKKVKDLARFDKDTKDILVDIIKEGNKLLALDKD